LQPQIVQALGRLSWSQLDISARLELLRAYGLTFARHGAPAPSLRESLLDTLNGAFPAEDVRVNRELCSLLVFLEAPEVAARTLDLLKQAPTQEEQIHYLLCLRSLKVGWSVEQRRTYFESFRTVASHRGGHSFTGFLKNIHKEAADSLDDATAQALGDLVKAPPAPAPVEGPARKLVKKWQVDELLQQVDKATATANLKRGRAVFTQALCYKCHRFRGQGGITGPDLTGVAGRFNNRNLLESLLEPNKVVSDQYATSTFVLADGRTVSGRVVNLSGNRIMVMTDMLNPGRPASVNRDQVDEVLPSTTSLMPTGLLDTFTAAEVLDLIAYLRSGGKRSNATLKAAARVSNGVSGGD
jgi:putative heme-binding domain-containing protein